MQTIINILGPLEIPKVPIDASLNVDLLTFIRLTWKVSLMIPADIYSVLLTQHSQRAQPADLRAVHEWKRMVMTMVTMMVMDHPGSGIWYVMLFLGHFQFPELPGD